MAIYDGTVSSGDGGTTAWANGIYGNTINTTDDIHSQYLLRANKMIPAYYDLDTLHYLNLDRTGTPLYTYRRQAQGDASMLTGQLLLTLDNNARHYIAHFSFLISQDILDNLDLLKAQCQASRGSTTGSASSVVGSVKWKVYKNAIIVTDSTVSITTNAPSWQSVYLTDTDMSGFSVGDKISGTMWLLCDGYTSNIAQTYAQNIEIWLEAS